MSDERERIEHPEWCDREACTAPELRPTLQEYRGASQIGAHESAPLQVSNVLGEELTARVWQGVTAWDTDVFLQLQVGNPDNPGTGTTISIGLGEDREGKGFELYELLGKAIGGLVRKYPMLYAERFPHLADTTSGGQEEQLTLDVGERAAKGCTHPADEPCFGRRRP